MGCQPPVTRLSCHRARVMPEACQRLASRRPASDWRGDGHPLHAWAPNLRPADAFRRAGGAPRELAFGVTNGVARETPDEPTKMGT